MARDSEPPRKVNGPRIPGAQAKPQLKKMRKIERSPRKYPKRYKDEVERAERVTDHNSIRSELSAAGQRMLKIQRLKELIEPISPSLIQVMSDIAHDPKVHAAVRLDAADRLLNRLYGKPTERVEMTDPTEDTVDADEVKTLLNRILESVGAPLLEFHDDAPATAPAPHKGEPT